MPTWKKSETVYEVKVGHHATRGSQLYLPKPIAEKLGEPDSVSFVVKEDTNDILLMSPKKAYVTKALETLEKLKRGRLSRKEAGRILLDLSREDAVEDDETLDEIFSDATWIDEPSREKGKLSKREINELETRLGEYLNADSAYDC